MSFPHINKQVKAAFRWYDDEGLRTRHTKACKDESADCPFALRMSNEEILPFQFVAAFTNDPTRFVDYAENVPTAWSIRDLDGNQVANLTEFIYALRIDEFLNPSRVYITLEEPLEHGLDLDDGLYEMRMTLADGSFRYSETFRICGTKEELEDCCYTLTWRSCGDVGTQRYAHNDFRNMIYLEASKLAYVGKAVAVYGEEQEDDKEGAPVTARVRKDVRWNVEMPGLPWFLIDALTEIPAHDDVQLMVPAGSGFDVIEQVQMSVSWAAGETCTGTVAWSFVTDESTVVNGCCEEYEPACIETCGEFDGILGIHEPELDDVFLMDRKNYRTFVGIGTPDDRQEGFGFLTACPTGLATTTQEGYEYVYWDGSDWVPAVVLTTVVGNGCEEGTFTFTGTSMGQFLVQIQYSVDEGVWIDVGEPVPSSNFVEGVTLELDVQPDEFRARIVGSDCVIANSTPVEAPYVGIEGLWVNDADRADANGSYHVYGTFNGRTQYQNAHGYLVQWIVDSETEPGTIYAYWRINDPADDAGCYGYQYTDPGPEDGASPLDNPFWNGGDWGDDVYLTTCS